jgi:hypothetical protein
MEEPQAHKELEGAAQRCASDMHALPLEIRTPVPDALHQRDESHLEAVVHLFGGGCGGGEEWLLFVASFRVFYSKRKKARQSRRQCRQKKGRLIGWAESVNRQQVWGTGRLDDLYTDCRSVWSTNPLKDCVWPAWLAGGSFIVRRFPPTQSYIHSHTYTRASFLTRPAHRPSSPSEKGLADRKVQLAMVLFSFHSRDLDGGAMGIFIIPEPALSVMGG